MLRTWRQQIKSNKYLGTENLLYPQKYRDKATHIAKQHWPIKVAGDNNRLMARMTRAMTGHAPIGAFRKRFKLPGVTDCPCGVEHWTREHTILSCRLWYRRENWWSRQLQNLQELDPFKGLVPFLQHNPLAFTFELADLHENAIREFAGFEVYEPVNQTSSQLGPYADPLGWTDEYLESELSRYLETAFPHREVGPHLRLYYKLVYFNRDLQPRVTAAAQRNDAEQDPYQQRWLRRFGKHVPNALNFNSQSTITE